MGVALAVATAPPPVVARGAEAVAPMVAPVLQWVTCGAMPMTKAMATIKTAATRIATP